MPWKRKKTSKEEEEEATKKGMVSTGANTAASAPPLESLGVSTPPGTAAAAEDITVMALQKCYEGLITVRSKAIKGKGAWYWTHLEPILVHHSDTGLPKAIKLRCSLCDAIFSSSKPSRTASEHLKRGTCPNFTSLPKPISSISPPLPPPPAASRKRASSSSSSYQIPPLAVIDPSRFCPEWTGVEVFCHFKEDCGRSGG